MARSRNLRGPLVLFASLFALAGCYSGPAASGSFDRNFNVSGPVRLELSNASGDVHITGSSDGKVHVHGDVRASGIGFDNPQRRLDDTIANPPVEQRGDTIRIGKDFSHLRNISIAYTIQVPHDTEVDASVASGAQNIRDLRGPVKVHAAAGTIRVEKIDKDADLSTASGSVTASDVGSDVQVSSASGNVTVSNVKGDGRVTAIAGVLRADIPIVIEEQGKHSLRARMGNGGGRVEVRTASGEIRISGAK